VAHRDIKPQNLVVTKDLDVIALDFNVSFLKNKSVEEFKMMTKTGTVAFSAPEIFTQKFYNEKVDVWSAGTVLYMMLSGEQPFYHD
jgi:serine/threonine protein kinase